MTGDIVIKKVIQLVEGPFKRLTQWAPFRKEDCDMYGSLGSIENFDVFVFSNQVLDYVDFLTGCMEEHETIAWKLRRYF